MKLWKVSICQSLCWVILTQRSWMLPSFPGHGAGGCKEWEKKLHLRASIVCLSSQPFQSVYFGLGVDRLVGGNDLKDTTIIAQKKAPCVAVILP